MSGETSESKDGISHHQMPPQKKTSPSIRTISEPQNVHHIPNISQCQWEFQEYRPKIDARYLQSIGSCCMAIDGMIMGYTIWLFNIAMENHHF